MTPLLLSLLLAQLSIPELDGAGAYRELEKGKFGVLSARDVKGSPYREYRVDADTPYTVAQLCEAVWGLATSGSATGVKLHRRLREEANLRVQYEQVGFPLISGRDYVMTVARAPTYEGDACRIRFRITNDEAPPVPEGFVRIERIYGEWHFTPRADGTAHVAYRMYSDPAGAVPPFIVHGAHRDAMKSAFNDALARTRKYAESGK